MEWISSGQKLIIWIQQDKTLGSGSYTGWNAVGGWLIQKCLLQKELNGTNLDRIK